MSRFVQLHLLTSYPPANLNRDDLGRPKTAKVGGVDRLRTSSQANKRAWRTSEIFESNIKNGIRTKMIGVDAFNKLSAFPALSRTIKEDIAGNIAQVFGKLKNNSLELETLVFISDTELSKIDDIINSYSNGLSGATEESNSLGVKLFTILSSDIQSTLNPLI
ncbi:MAG: type I-E CRISPR-associated protein Cas7/Cse4/CasC, partial [Deltaproteobacteria bacterium]|nr:type I-E CRISPR-associated protein Cas7/Cse4/CasC [Deltaproteobacteria bacterium]